MANYIDITVFPILKLVGTRSIKDKTVNRYNFKSLPKHEIPMNAYGIGSLTRSRSRRFFQPGITGGVPYLALRSLARSLYLIFMTN